MLQQTSWHWHHVSSLPLSSPACTDEGEAAAQWVSSYLGLPARLVRYSGATDTDEPPPDADPRRRPLDPLWTPPPPPPPLDPGVDASGEGEGAHFEVAFADGFPYLIANEV